jgi:acyl carrier protein
MDTFGEVQQVIASNLGVPIASVQLESKASDFSEWDSVRHLVLVMDVEQAFGLKFSMEEIAELDSVEKIVKAVQERVKT